MPPEAVGLPPGSRAQPDDVRQAVLGALLPESLRAGSKLVRSSSLHAALMLSLVIEHAYTCCKPACVLLVVAAVTLHTCSGLQVTIWSISGPTCA